MIEKADFEAWQASPVTELVQKALRAKAAEAKAKWVSASWEGGNIDPQLLADLRARAQMCADLAELSFEDMEAALEPVRDLPDRV